MTGNVNLYNTLQNDLAIFIKILEMSILFEQEIHFWESPVECSKHLAFKLFFTVHF